MFSFFKKKPAAPESPVETPVAEAAPETTAETGVQAAPEAPATEQVPASGGWLNRLRRSFGGDEASPASADAPAASGELPLAEQALIQALQHDAMDSSFAALEPTPIDEAALTEAALAATPEEADDVPASSKSPAPRHAEQAPAATPEAQTPAAASASASASADEPVADDEAAAADTATRAGWFNRLKTGLRRTGSSITTVFTGTRIDEELYEDLEAALLMADAGVQATEYLLEDLKRRVKAAKATDPAQVRTLLTDAIAELLAPLEKQLVIGEHTPTVIMVAGVNGAGKTTSIGKLTKHLSDHQQSVLLAAADTFRAAAREQLAVWADRNTVEIVSNAGGDPAALSFDAVAAGRARGKNVVLVDTAGRLPTQLHLMDELRKIRRTITKAYVTAPHEVLLVIDGNTGQNALAQVRAFDDALELTGLIVTKLDGTAKGGVLCAIAREKPVPVYFVGVGEKLEDLETFNAREFAQALLG